MSMQVFLLPDLGEGLTEAEIVEWKVKPGDTVTIDQVVVEVETAKASVEVPCPFEGVVGELHAAEGTSLAVGAPLISITGGAVADTPAGRLGECTDRLRHGTRSHRTSETQCGCTAVE